MPFGICTKALQASLVRSWGILGSPFVRFRAPGSGFCNCFSHVLLTATQTQPEHLAQIPAPAAKQHAAHAWVALEKVSTKTKSLELQRSLSSAFGLYVKICTYVCMYVC